MMTERRVRRSPRCNTDSHKWNQNSEARYEFRTVMWRSADGASDALV